MNIFFYLRMNGSGFDPSKCKRTDRVVTMVINITFGVRLVKRTGAMTGAVIDTSWFTIQIAPTYSVDSSG